MPIYDQPNVLGLLACNFIISQHVSILQNNPLILNSAREFRSRKRPDHLHALGHLDIIEFTAANYFNDDIVHALTMLSSELVS